MFDRQIVQSSARSCHRGQELIEKSENLCRESRWLINASKELLGDLDDFLSEFDSHYGSKTT